jgi:hypothetical protein
MRKFLIAASWIVMCGSAFAQSGTTPTPQGDTTNKPGAAATTSGTSPATGSSSMHKEGMKNDSASQGGASKDGSGQMNKGGTSK